MTVMRFCSMMSGIMMFTLINIKLLFIEKQIIGIQIYEFQTIISIGHTLFIVT